MPPTGSSAPRALALASLLLLSALIAVAGTVQATFTGTELVDAYWGSPGTRAEVSPGDVGRTLTLELRNIDDDNLGSLEAELRPPDTLTPTYEGADVAQRSQVLAPGELWTPTFSLDLSPSLSPGQTVEIPGTISMREGPNATSPGPYRALSFTAEIPITGTSRLTVHAEDASIRAHSEVNLTLEVANDGDTTARDLELAIAPSTGSTLQILHPAGAVDLADLSPGNTTTVQVDLATPGTPGPQGLDLTLTYVDAAGTQRTRAQTVPLSVTAWAQGPLDIALETEQLTAGRDGTLTFALENARGERMEGLAVDLVIDGGSIPPTLFPRSGGYTYDIGTLEPGQNRTLEIPVTVAAIAPEAHALQLTFTWTGPQGLQHDWTYQFGIRAQGAIELVLSETCGFLDRTTGEVTASATITNLGNRPALNAYAAFHLPGIEQHERTELGDIDPNDPFRFEITGARDQLPANATAAREIEVMLFWNDERGTEVTQVASLPLEVSSVPEASNPCTRTFSGPPDDGNLLPAPGPLALVVALGSAAALAVRRRS